MLLGNKLYPGLSQQKPGPQVTSQLEEESLGTPKPSVDPREQKAREED